ncbi:MAG: nucleotidyltransferase family protein [Flavobacteriales bacterium]
MENKAQLTEALQANAAEIQAFGVIRLGVFGSFARDTATADSDVDLFVDFDPDQKSLKNLVGLSRFLEGLLGRKVDLVTPASLNPFIGKHILQEVQYVSLAA